MTDGPFVTQLHLEPAQSRRDVDAPTEASLNALLASLGIGPERRLELYGRDGLTVMTVEAHGDAFHISIQVGETQYYCFRPGSARGIADLGPFAFEAAELCHGRSAMSDLVRSFWARGERAQSELWTRHDASDALSPLNNSMDKASAEVGAMFQSFRAGNRGGPATLRVRGEWNASPATRADMKLLARWLELTQLTAIDADGTTRSFSGQELFPVAAGGKRWRKWKFEG